MVSVKGDWRLPKTGGKKDTLAGDAQVLSKMGTQFHGLEKLLRLSSNWVVEIAAHDDGWVARGWGTGFVWQGTRVEGPQLAFSYPQNVLLAGAELLQGKWGTVASPSVLYRWGVANSWDASVGNSTIRGFKMLGGVANGTADLGASSLAGGVKVGGARVFLTQGNGVADEVSLSPMRARFRLYANADFLQDWGIKISSKDRASATGNYHDGNLDFAMLARKGNFWGYDFSGAYAKGMVNPEQARIDRWNMSSADGQAEGMLNYEFGSHRIHHEIFGVLAPYHLPWFGDWWNDLCALLKQAQPAFAITYEDAPDQNPKIAGIAGARDFVFRRLGVDEGSCSVSSRDLVTDVNFTLRHGAENGTGSAQFNPPGRKISFTGRITPASLAAASLDQTPPALEKLTFSELPFVAAHEQDGLWDVQARTAKPGKFYSLDFDYARATVRGDASHSSLDPLEFGFAGGDGRAEVTFHNDATGEGSLSLSGANLGEWSLLGPLGESLRGTLLGFSNLDLNAAKAQFKLSPDSVEVPSVEFTGDEHAVSGSGTIYPNRGTLDFTVRLKTLGGTKTRLGLLAPIIQPITSVVEANLSGPIDSPKWKFKLTTPSLILK
jgi:hypothetical protein